MAKPKVTSVLGFVFDLIQIACALIVIILTSWKLINVDIEGVTFNSDCLLNGAQNDDGPLSGSKFCVYVIAVGVISFLVNAIFGCIRTILKCVTLNACGASKIVAVIGDVALGIWWAIAFALIAQRGIKANDLDWPERPARDGVIAASFGATAAFFADAVVTVCGMVLSRRSNS